jgi:ubiquinone/menaquinone biosynthesis C-methylase UbiE/uncharacterized membrane protein YbhN (UPF0104 family)
MMTLVGVALNIFVPATLGDIARSYYGYKIYGIKEEMLSTVIVDKMFALCSLFLLGAMSGYIMGYYGLGTVSLFSAVLTFIPLIFPSLVPWNIVNIILGVFKKSLDIKKLLKAFILPSRLKVSIMIISIGGWLCTCVFFYVLCSAFPVKVSLGYIILIMPVLTIVRLFPFTVNALGPMEIAVAYFFSVIGINSTLAVLISLLSNVISSVIPGVIGFLIILTRGYGRRQNDDCQSSIINHQSSIRRTGERVIPENFLQSKEAYLLYLKHLFAYESAKEFISEKSSIIEVGCGEGYGTHFLSHHVQHIIGLDVDESVIQHASNKYSSETCTFQIYNGLQIPYDDNTYDAVISFQVIEHVQNDICYLAEIQRILKPTGVCLLTTPNSAYRVKPNKKPWNRFHVREYYADELEALLKSIFSEVRVWGIRGNEEIENIEKVRVKQAQRFAALDPLNLRRFIPASYETRIATELKKLLYKKRTTQNNDDFLKKYSTHDFYITRDTVEDSLDLFAIM